MGGSHAAGGGPRLGVVAGVLAASVALSRVLGIVREAVLSRVLGVGADVDAYRAAFLLPDLLNYFLAGGALSIAFIPFYARLREQQGEEAAARFLAVVLGTTGALAAAATVGLWLGADALVATLYPKFGGEQAVLTARLTRILLPAQVFFIVGGVLKGALMARGRFAAQALAPLVYNLGIIAGGLALGTRIGAEGFAWGALAGAFAGPFAAAWLETRRVPGLRPSVRLGFRDAELRRYLVTALPLMLGVTLLTVDEWYDRVFGALLATGSVAALAYARQLMQLPVAVVGQALATAALPTLARYASEGRTRELDETLLGTLRAALTLACLGAAGAFVFAEPLVRFVYEGGAFEAADTARVAHLLRIFAFAVPAWVVQQIAARGFYARGDTWRPMWLGSAVAALAVGPYYVLGQHLGAPGLAVAGAVGMSANALATLLLLRRLHGGPALAPLAASAGRAAAIAALAGAIGAAVPPTGEGALGALLQLALGGAVFAGGALAGVHWFGDASQRAALAALLRPLRRRS